MEHSGQPIKYPIFSRADLDTLQYRSQLCSTNQYGRLLRGAPALILRLLLLCAGGCNVFGELRSQPSRLAPDAAMDPAVGQLVASGLASASTMLAASLLRSAFRCLRLSIHPERS